LQRRLERCNNDGSARMDCLKIRKRERRLRRGGHVFGRIQPQPFSAPKSNSLSSRSCHHISCGTENMTSVWKLRPFPCSGGYTLSHRNRSEDLIPDGAIWPTKLAPRSWKPAQHRNFFHRALSFGRLWCRLLSSSRAWRTSECGK
jgi:hypothetical protein